jgi:hypothetical protein
MFLSVIVELCRGAIPFFERYRSTRHLKFYTPFSSSSPKLLLFRLQFSACWKATKM